MLASKTILVGADIGTSGCKIVVINDKGNIITKKFIPYPTFVRADCAEQDPETWFDAFRRGIRWILSRTRAKRWEIAAVGIDGMMNSLVLLGKNGDVISPSIIWMDQRSAPQAERARMCLKDIVLNGPITATALLSKILWLMENQRDIWINTSHILLPKDYVRYRLTGIICTEPSDASATQLFDLHLSTWSEVVCETLGIERSKLPPIVPSHEIVGKIQTGELKGVPIVAGCSDAAADALAVGVVNPGDCLIRLGTCGALFLVHNVLPSGNKERKQSYILAHCIPARWLLHSLTPAGLAIEWFKRTFAFKDYATIERMARQAPLGSEGLLFYPYLLGEHTPKMGQHLCGCFWGITSIHGRQHFARAVLEGISFSIKECFDSLISSEISIKAITVAGGGAHSPIWLRILSEVLGRTLQVPTMLDASLGAAMLAGIGVGVFKDVTDAVKNCVALERAISPRESAYQQYSAFFQHYLSTWENVVPPGGKK